MFSDQLHVIIIVDYVEACSFAVPHHVSCVSSEVVFPRVVLLYWCFYLAPAMYLWVCPGNVM